MAAPAATSPVGVRAAVTVGLRLACVTITVSVWEALPPLPSDTVTFAEYVPGALYAWFALAVAAVPLSPKSHAYVRVSPSGSVPVAVKAIEVPVVVLPAGVREALTVGFWLAATTVTGTSALAVPPLPSDTVTLAVYVPTAA